MNELEIFTNAVEIGDRQKRSEYLNSVCGEDTTLRSSVDDLLALHDTSGDFLETPVLAVGEPAHEPESGQLIGRYQLVGKIGEGGFGEVWKAEQQEPVQRTVALKIIKPGMDTRQVIARFEIERQTLAMMNHRNIAAVLDAGKTEHGRPFFVMELVDGKSIDHFCDDQQMPLGERLKLFAQICRAVQHAHQKGIVHRDIKPSNILVEEIDGRAEAKVIDFGIAKAMQNTPDQQVFATASKQLMGTPEFMSPEQLAVDPDIDTRTDVYALGGVLYKLLVGVAPLDLGELRKTGMDEVARAIREVEPPRPSVRILQLENRQAIAERRSSLPVSLSRSLRGDLDWIVSKTLEKERARRYGSVSELAQDIDSHLACLPVSAGPPEVMYRAKKFVRRNRAAVIATALVLFSVFSGAVIATIGFVKAEQEQRRTAEQWRRAERERNKADQQRQLAEQERTKAEQQQQRAIDEAGKATQFAQLLETLIETAGPEGGHPANVAMLRELDEFADTFPTELQGRPESEAKLRRTVGNLYMRMRQIHRAGPHLQRALELRRDLFEDQDPRTIQSQVEWADWLQSQSRSREAEQAIQPVLATLRDREPSAELVLALDVLSKVRWLDINTKSRDELLREAWDVSRQVYGEDAPTSLKYQSRYAFKCVARHDLTDAEKLSLDALTRVRSTLPEEHLDVATIKFNHAMVLFDQGELLDAERLIRETNATYHRLVGDESLLMVACMTSLAKILQAQGRVEEALALARSAVATAERGSSQVDRQRYDAYTLLANMTQRIEPEESINMQVRALAARRRLSSDYRGVVGDLNNLAFKLRRIGRWEQAAQHYQDALDVLDRTPNRTASLVLTLRALADLWMEVGEPLKAEALLRDAIRVSNRPLPILRIDQMQALIDAGQIERAKQTEEKIAINASRTQSSTAQGTTLVVQAQLLLTESKPDEAEALLRESLELYPKVPLRQLAWRIDGLLCDCQIQRGEYAEAEQVLLDAITRVKQRTRSFTPRDRRRVVLQLVSLYDEWGKPEESAHWREYLKRPLVYGPLAIEPE